MSGPTETNHRYRMAIVTTVPDTMFSILGGQPGYLSNFFDIVLVTSPGPLVSKIEQREGLDVTIVPMERGINPLKDLLSIFNMWRVLRKERPDIVHSYTPKAGLVAMLSAWLCRVPLRVHTFTGLIFPTATGLKQRILIWVDRLICASATHIVPEGLGVQKDLERYRITRKPLKVIGHGNIAGVDTSHFDPDFEDAHERVNGLREQLSLEPQATVFCFVGRLNRDKGISELYEAFSRLPENVSLLLVGGIDASAPISKELQERLESDERIHLLGFMDDIRPALGLADVLVLPSYREGFPNVVLQAGAMELPVIASDISGCNEVIQPGMNGWLVPARDAKSLRTAMEEAIHTPTSLRMQMGMKARERVQLCFERRQHWNRMVSFYQNLLSSHPRADQ